MEYSRDRGEHRFAYDHHGRAIGYTKRGEFGHWRAYGPCGEQLPRAYRSRSEAELGLVTTMREYFPQLRPAPPAASLLPLDLIDQGKRKLHGDAANHHVIAPSGRKDGAVTSTRDGRVLAWARDALIGAHATPEEADRAVERTVR